MTFDTVPQGKLLVNLEKLGINIAVNPYVNDLALCTTEFHCISNTPDFKVELYSYDIPVLLHAGNTSQLCVMCRIH